MQYDYDINKSLIYFVLQTLKFFFKILNAIWRSKQSQCCIGDNDVLTNIIRPNRNHNF